MKTQSPALCYELVGVTEPRMAVPRWHLDSPAQGVACERVGHERFRLRGWVLPDITGKTSRTGVAVRSDGLTRAYPLNQWRGDVLSRMLNLVHAEHPDLVCGFDLTLREATELDFGLDLDGTLVWLVRMRKQWTPIKMTGG